MILTGDCLDVMPTLDAESASAIVTDPPYGLGFMGKAWDAPDGPGGLGDVPMRRRAELNKVNTGVGRQGGRQRSTADFAKRQARDAREYQAWCEQWAEEAFRVAKPGAHLLAFGGTRTYHRLATAIEDAGWEIRDCLVWGYASGFPKSHNLDGDWQGWGTALKPAWEPIVMARKPLRGTVAANVAEHGTGALNIDGTRIPFAGPADMEFMATRIEAWSKQEGWDGPAAINVGQRRKRDGYSYPNGPKGNVDPTSFNAGRREEPVEADPQGRWPANIVLTEPIFDGGIEGVVGGGETASGFMAAGPKGDTGWFAERSENYRDTFGDAGTYSRFFLIPKADRAEREPVVGSLPIGRVSPKPDGRQWDIPGSHSKSRQNVHPTVKPVDLMRHLVRLVTPPGGMVLDPFLGSGTTGIACELEGFPWTGIEREAEYVAIAEARLHGVQRGIGLAV